MVCLKDRCLYTTPNSIHTDLVPTDQSTPVPNVMWQVHRHEGDIILSFRSAEISIVMIDCHSIGNGYFAVDQMQLSIYISMVHLHVFLCTNQHENSHGKISIKRPHNYNETLLHAHGSWHTIMKTNRRNSTDMKFSIKIINWIYIDNIHTTNRFGRHIDTY